MKMVRETYMMNTEGRLDRQFKFDKMIADICGETKDDEWIQYTIDNPNEAAKWSLDLRYAVNSGTSTVRITVNDRPVTASTSLSSTGGWTSWATKTWQDIVLPQGTLRVRIYLEKAGLNLNWFRLYNKTQATDEELAVLNETPQDNMLTNSECEFQGAWRTAALQSINDAKFTWNSATNKPSKGTGNCWSDEAWHVYHH